MIKDRIRYYLALSGTVEVEVTHSSKDWRDNDSVSFAVFIDGNKVGRASVIGTPSGYFLDSVLLENAFQFKGHGEKIYQAIERTLGKELMPSPLGLSGAAVSIWKKRLASKSAAEVNRMLDRATAIGVMMGAREEHVIERLQPLRR